MNAVAKSTCQQRSTELKWEDAKIDNHSNDKLKANLWLEACVSMFGVGVCKYVTNFCDTQVQLDLAT
jgi:hypothetical protein